MSWKYANAVKSQQKNGNERDKYSERRKYQLAAVVVGSNTIWIETAKSSELILNLKNDVDIFLCAPAFHPHVDVQLLNYFFVCTYVSLS
jgi:hypothetical protein